MKPLTLILRFMQSFWTLLLFTLRQLSAQRGLTLAILLGLLTTTTISMSIPIYADAVYQDVLEKQLYVESGSENAIRRPPFSFMFRYVGAWDGPVGYELTLAADAYLSGQAAADLRLPLESFTRYYKTIELRLFAGEESNYDASGSSLDYVSFSTVSSLEEHIVLLEGNMPLLTPVGGAVEVLVTENFANKLGLQSGETLKVYERVDTSLGEVRVEIPVIVSGVWRASDENDPYWFYGLSWFDTVLLTHQDAFTQQVLPTMNNEINLALWYLVLDGSQVNSSDVPQVVRRISYTRQRAFNYLPGIRLDVSPLDRLNTYQEKSLNLTRFLYSFSLPFLGMVLSFISLVSSMAIQQRRAQIVTLRSRGATSLQLVGIAAFESSFLGALSLLLGVPLALLIAYFMGQTRSFLDFSGQVDLAVRFPNTAWQAGLLVVGFNLLAQVLPMFGASRYTIVTYKQDRSRQTRPAWWQRAWFDILLLIPTGYGIYLLQQPGGRIAGMPNDPFQNPFLLLLPALGIIGLTLFFLRLLPRLMQGLAWLVERTSYVGLLLAARQLSRLGSDFHAPLVLLIFTLSLSTFTASMAETLDQYLYDKNYYEIGADMKLDETGELNPSLREFTFGAGNTSQDSQAEEGPHWFFLPVSEHLRVPGVQSAARLGWAQGRVSLSAGSAQVRFLGIDRLDFPKVAFWRDDFAPEPLGALMNKLALTTEGVLIQHIFYQQHAFQPGDTLRLTVNVLGNTYPVEFKIVGVFDLFPAWNPQDGPLIVGNLDYLYEQVGTVFPYDVLIKTKTGADYDGIVKGLERLEIIVLSYQVSQQRLDVEQLRPERQGLFGLLSIGFLALAFLTVLGFFLYALFSFRSRFIELGMLRALGLSSGQLVLYLTLELAFLLLVGLGAGTGLGVWASDQFIPILQMGGGPETRLPPFIIQIGWPSVFRIYILFSLLFVAALSTLSALLLRMKIFQAIKMGEMA